MENLLEAKPVTTTLMDMAITGCMPYTSVSNKLSGSKNCIHSWSLMLPGFLEP
jgi:hypothetical protein